MLYDSLKDMLFRHLVTLFLILLFSIRLRARKSFRNAETRFFWLTLISCLLLVLEDILEIITANDPSLRFWRILFSALGYTFRSTAALGLLLVITPPKRRNFIVWIPALITLATCGTAFFTDIAFGYDEAYHFYRGPLGYVAFIVPMLYLLLILWVTFRYFSEKNGVSRVIMLTGGLFCLAAAIADATAGGVRLNEALLISSILFYTVLYSHDNRRDPLTGLLNRQAFYDDCAACGRSVAAAASLDMNGLKELNDSQGHQAGDEALARIGACVTAAVDRNTLAYRVGGDEFVILFFNANEERIIQTRDQIIKSVSKDGLSVSAGYALRKPQQPLDETVKESDRRMYENKAEYYRANSRDRRKKRASAP